jgi:hypothetical protein
MTKKTLWPSLLSALLLFSGGCGDDESSGDGGAAPAMDGSTDEGEKDAGRDAYVWMPSGGVGGGGSGGSGGSGTGGSGGTGGSIAGRMCAEPRDYLPDAFLPRCSADTAECIAGCASEAACIYLTLFACIDMTACHDGVAEVFCCIEDNCPSGSAEGCSEQLCGGEIEAALICGYNANIDCVDFTGDVLGQCFAAGDEDAGL